MEESSANTRCSIGQGRNYADMAENGGKRQRIKSLIEHGRPGEHTDNGSEFLGKFHEELEKEKIEHYFSYPKCPKQHGTVERFNGIMRREFLEEGNLFYNMETMNKKLINWLIEYNFHRPHETLEMRPPIAVYFNLFYKSRLSQGVHLKLWNRTTT